MRQSSSKWFQLLILLTAPLLTVIDVFIINVAIPSIKKGIHSTDSEVQLIIAMYLLGYASFQITGSRAGDYFGRKKIFMWGMFFFTLSSCFCGFSNTPFQLISARFLQGVSGAFMLPQSLAYIQILFPDAEERTKAIGYLGITLGVASILGQFLGGFLSETYFITDGWRLIFFINLPVGIAALVATAAYLQKAPKNQSGQFDYSGVVILTAGLVSLIYPLIQGREQGYPLWSILLFVLSLFIFIYFVANQKTKLNANKNPLIDVGLFKIKDFNIGILAVVFYFMMHTSYLLICTVYFQNGLNISAWQSGLYFVCFGVLFTLSSFLSIKLVIRYGKSVLQTGVLIIIAAFALQVTQFSTDIHSSTIYLLMGIYGLGSGLVLPSLVNIALKSVPAHFAGAAAGIYNTFQQAASSLGICIIGGIFYYVIDAHRFANTYSTAFHYGMIAEIACLLIVGFLLYVLPKAKSSNHEVLVID